MNDVARLRWRCRRGTKELDIVLERFLQDRYAGLDNAGRRRFERLLDCDDGQLIDWILTGRDAPRDGELDIIVASIRGACAL